MFLGSLVKGISLKGYVEKNLFEMSSLQTRHDALVQEMEKRYITHNSPLSRGGDQVVSSQIRNSKIDRARAEADLLNRCPECKKRKELIEEPPLIEGFIDDYLKDEDEDEDVERK